MRHPLTFVCFEKWWGKLAFQPWLLLRKVCWSHCWLIRQCAVLCIQGSAAERRGRTFLPVSFPILSDDQQGIGIKSFPNTDEGTNLQQPTVVHHCVGCQKLAEVLPSGAEHQLWLWILLVVLDDWQVTCWALHFHEQSKEQPDCYFPISALTK